MLIEFLDGLLDFGFEGLRYRTESNCGWASRRIHLYGVRRPLELTKFVRDQVWEFLEDRGQSE